MTDDPKRDFRYRDEAGVELEAYRISPSARWLSQEWPDWLQTQGSAKEINKVYTDPASPNTLFINLESGRFGIEENAYVIYENGTLRVENGEQFDERFTKVVPIPPRNLDAPSLENFERTHRIDENNKLVKLTEEEIAALPPEEDVIGSHSEMAQALRIVEPVTQPIVQGSYAELRAKAEIAYEFMLEADPQQAKSILKRALSDETVWCSCAPGNCVGGPRWSCRQNSPLVKS
jgi:hypothetical protein